MTTMADVVAEKQSLYHVSAQTIPTDDLARDRSSKASVIIRDEESVVVPEQDAFKGAREAAVFFPARGSLISPGRFLHGLRLIQSDVRQSLAELLNHS